MNIKLYRQWVIRDKNGKVIKRTRKRLSDSYVIGFINSLNVEFSRVTQDIKDTGNVTRAVTASLSEMWLDAITGEDGHGLVVGTGTNAVALTDYALQTQIAHGTGAGQLQYAINTVNAPTTDGSTRKFTITRTFTNGSGSTITVNETGIYWEASGGSWYFCLARDLESPGQDIADAATGTLTYTISITA